MNKLLEMLEDNSDDERIDRAHNNRGSVGSKPQLIVDGNDIHVKVVWRDNYPGAIKANNRTKMMLGCLQCKAQGQRTLREDGALKSQSTRGESGITVGTCELYSQMLEEANCL